MCGIYSLVSSREPGPPPGDELFGDLGRLAEETAPAALRVALEQDGGLARLVERLDAVRAGAGRYVSRPGCLALLADPRRVERLRAAARRVREWAQGLEELVESGAAVRQSQREAVNRLVVGGHDVAWQLERDVLGALDAVRELAPDGSPGTLARAWELHLVLRSLDRLEVRGRDSAGVTVAVRFPSADALDGFLDRPGGPADLRVATERRADPRLGHGAVLRPSAAPDTLVFVWKVASEVGKMGENVAFLRAAIVEDVLFRAALAEPDLEVRTLSHTRWASNGVVSVPNCHPVDGTLLRDGAVVEGSVGRLLACLNGDIDNYRELVERHVTARGLALDPAVTTDAKIIPVVVESHLEDCGDLEEAFRRAVAEFEGSMAIGLLPVERPGTLLFAQKGSGQGLFFGLAGETVAAASEMYGVVELTPEYVKAEGESRPEGELFRAEARERGVRLEALGPRGFAAVPSSRVRRAEITTRDINRGSHPHFFVKEIKESVESVRKTLRGKIEWPGEGPPRVLLGPDVLPVELVAGLREGRVRTVRVVGQGTAAVAAEGVAHLLDAALASLDRPVHVAAEKATELSAHRLRDDMSGTLVVAVSQSGTTTDTNRTVDLARERGAWVISIVNRRNSDLVYKSHGVLYTSDGRDIEMSVASTKAFYAQNVAGQVLALGLGQQLGTLSDEGLRQAAGALRSLPSVLERTLELEDRIADLARTWALRRRHWAAVGSGGAKVAADEVRIKLSELCYKSIACDFTEDKKHIDLSSEPLVLVCAAGLAGEIVSDTVKEVAIFKAHRAVPVVLVEEDRQGAFEAYASGIVPLPRCDGVLAYLPAAMAGHLFGYHAATALDGVADRLRALRGEVVRRQEELGRGEDAALAVLGAVSSGAAGTLSDIERTLGEGGLDGGLGAGLGVRLERVIQLLLGRLSIDGFARRSGASGGAVQAVLESLSECIAELSRPIDAIKHQAKTVTVGISRGAARPVRGAVERALEELGVGRGDLLETHRIFIAAFDPLVRSVDGVSSYRLGGLDPLGRPGPDSRIVIERKGGTAVDIASRCEREQPLSGTKWAAVKHREIHLGYGQTDGRRILILPVVGESAEGRLVLLHLTLKPAGPREARRRALEARSAFYDRLRAAITERNIEWDSALLDGIDNDTLFLLAPESVAEELAHTNVG